MRDVEKTNLPNPPRFFAYPKYPILCSRKDSNKTVVLQEYSDTSKHRRYWKKGKVQNSIFLVQNAPSPQLLCTRIPDPRERRRAKAFKGYGRCALYCGSRIAGSKQGGGGDIILRSNFVCVGYVAGIRKRIDGAI
jgi:hypothetical protein